MMEELTLDRWLYGEDYKKQRRKKYCHDYYLKNISRLRVHYNDYYFKNRDRIRARHMEYNIKNADIRRAQGKKYRLRMKELVISHYSNNENKCICCGMMNNLTLDHIDSGKDRNSKCRLHGVSMYRWLISEGFPEGYQILCHECNSSKNIYNKCSIHNKILTIVNTNSDNSLSHKLV